MSFRSSVVVLPVFLVFLSGCVKKQQSAQQLSTAASSPSIGNVSETATVTKRSDRAPNFTWKDSTGKTVDFDSFRGKVTLVNFWATWCGPCKRELPDLISLSGELAGRNVRFLGVSTDRGPNVIDDVRSFVNEHAIPYQVVVSNEDLEDAFGNPRAIPTTYLVDANGKIAETFVGMRSKAIFAQAIDKLLQQ